VRLTDFALLGELSLNGSLRPVHGMLSMAASLHKQSLYGMIVPTQNAREAATANGPLVYCVSTLNEAVDILEGDVRQRPYELNIEEFFKATRTTLSTSRRSAARTTPSAHWKSQPPEVTTC
jgi:magnesium chelatase family protein